MIDADVLKGWNKRIDKIRNAVQQAEQAGRLRSTSARLILDQLQLAQERVATLDLHSDRWLTDPLRSARILTDSVPDIEQAIVAAICRAERTPEPKIARPKPTKERPVKPYTGPADTQCAYPGCTKKVRARGYCNGHYTRLRANGTLQVNRTSRAWCVVDGCENPAYAKGWCMYHYDRQGADGLYGQRKTWPEVCSVDGCNRKSGALGLCEKHLNRKYKYGTPDAPRPLKAEGTYITPRSGQELCIADGCDRPAVAHYLCMRHYKQRRRKHQGQHANDQP